MQYKNSKKLLIDQRKLESLFRLGCPDKQIIDLLKTGTFESTGDSLIDDMLESLIDYRVFENWGGTRTGAGRKSKKSAKKNQLENQDDNQDEKQLANQDANHLACQVVDKDIDKDIENKSNKGGVGEKERKRFVKPTLEEIQTYCKERLNMVNPERFMDYYESNGWRVGKNPMKDWKAAIRTWEKSSTPTPTPITHTVRLSAREAKDLENKQKMAALMQTLTNKGY